jgi:hypothetical protein
MFGFMEWSRQSGSRKATSSAGEFAAEIATTMYCFPFNMYVIGVPV